MSRQSGPSPSNEAPLNSFTGSWRLPSGEPAARTGRFRVGRPARGTRVARNKRKTEPADRTGRFVSGGRRAERVSPETGRKGAVAVAQIWALYQTGARPRCPARCGGHIWDAMGNYGRQRFLKDNYGAARSCAQFVFSLERRPMRHLRNQKRRVNLYFSVG